jgi:uncharacterized protein
MARSRRPDRLILYLDTSALVKPIVREAGADAVIDWLGRADLVASSVVTYAEACSALGQNDRRRDKVSSKVGEWLVALDEYWREVMWVPVAEKVAGRLALSHELRGMDAVQLAGAVALRERLRAGAADSATAEIVFAAFDRRLLDAADREGFATLGGPRE